VSEYGTSELERLNTDEEVDLQCGDRVRFGNTGPVFTVEEGLPLHLRLVLARAKISASVGAESEAASKKKNLMVRFKSKPSPSDQYAVKVSMCGRCATSAAELGEGGLLSLQDPLLHMSMDWTSLENDRSAQEQKIVLEFWKEESSAKKETKSSLTLVGCTEKILGDILASTTPVTIPITSQGIAMGEIVLDSIEAQSAALNPFSNEEASLDKLARSSPAGGEPENAPSQEPSQDLPPRTDASPLNRLGRFFRGSPRGQQRSSSAASARDESPASSAGRFSDNVTGEDDALVSGPNTDKEPNTEKEPNLEAGPAQATSNASSSYVGRLARKFRSPSPFSRRDTPSRDRSSDSQLHNDGKDKGNTSNTAEALAGDTIERIPRGASGGTLQLEFRVYEARDLAESVRVNVMGRRKKGATQDPYVKVSVCGVTATTAAVMGGECKPSWGNEGELLLLSIPWEALEGEKNPSEQVLQLEVWNEESADRGADLLIGVASKTLGEWKKDMAGGMDGVCNLLAKGRHHGSLRFGLELRSQAEEAGASQGEDESALLKRAKAAGKSLPALELDRNESLVESHFIVAANRALKEVESLPVGKETNSPPADSTEPPPQSGRTAETEAVIESPATVGESDLESRHEVDVHAGFSQVGAGINLFEVKGLQSSSQNRSALQQRSRTLEIYAMLRVGDISVSSPAALALQNGRACKWGSAAAGQFIPLGDSFDLDRAENKRLVVEIWSRPRQTGTSPDPKSVNHSDDILIGAGSCAVAKALNADKKGLWVPLEARLRRRAGRSSFSFAGGSATDGQARARLALVLPTKSPSAEEVALAETHANLPFTLNDDGHQDAPPTSSETLVVTEPPASRLDGSPSNSQSKDEQQSVEQEPPGEHLCELPQIERGEQPPPKTQGVQGKTGNNSAVSFADEIPPDSIVHERNPYEEEPPSSFTLGELEDEARHLAAMRSRKMAEIQEERDMVASKRAKAREIAARRRSASSRRNGPAGRPLRVRPQTEPAAADHAASCRIQALYRGHLARVRVRRSHVYATRIQAAFRGRRSRIMFCAISARARRARTEEKERLARRRRMADHQAELELLKLTKAADLHKIDVLRGSVAAYRVQRWWRRLHNLRPHKAVKLSDRPGHFPGTRVEERYTAPPRPSLGRQHSFVMGGRQCKDMKLADLQSRVSACVSSRERKGGHGRPLLPGSWRTDASQNSSRASTKNKYGKFIAVLCYIFAQGADLPCAELLIERRERAVALAAARAASQGSQNAASLRRSRGLDHFRQLLGDLERPPSLCVALEEMRKIQHQNASTRAPAWAQDLSPRRKKDQGVDDHDAGAFWQLPTSLDAQSRALRAHRSTKAAVTGDACWWKVRLAQDGSCTPCDIRTMLTSRHAFCKYAASTEVDDDEASLWWHAFAQNGSDRDSTLGEVLYDRVRAGAIEQRRRTDHDLDRRSAALTLNANRLLEQVVQRQRAAAAGPGRRFGVGSRERQHNAAVLLQCRARGWLSRQRVALLRAEVRVYGAMQVLISELRQPVLQEAGFDPAAKMAAILAGSVGATPQDAEAAVARAQEQLRAVEKAANARAHQAPPSAREDDKEPLNVLDGSLTCSSPPALKTLRTQVEEASRIAQQEIV
jgi:hypothetical protein